MIIKESFDLNHIYLSIKILHRNDFLNRNDFQKNVIKAVNKCNNKWIDLYAETDYLCPNAQLILSLN